MKTTNCRLISIVAMSLFCGHVMSSYGQTESIDAHESCSIQDKQSERVSIAKTRNLRYGEILIIRNDGAEVYNTTGLNDCPAELWDTMDMVELAKEFGALRVQKNGPKYWMMDSQTIMFGEKANF